MCDAIPRIASRDLTRADRATDRPFFTGVIAAGIGAAALRRRRVFTPRAVLTPRLTRQD